MNKIIIFISIWFIFINVFCKKQTIEKNLNINVKKIIYNENFLNISNVLHMDSNYYLVDFTDKKIKLFNKDFKYVNEFGGKGEGPLEILLISSIQKYNKNILCFDPIKRKLLILDNKLNVKFIKILKNFDSFGNYVLNGNNLISSSLKDVQTISFYNIATNEFYKTKINSYILNKYKNFENNILYSVNFSKIYSKCNNNNKFIFSHLSVDKITPLFFVDVKNIIYKVLNAKIDSNYNLNRKIFNFDKNNNNYDYMYINFLYLTDNNRIFIHYIVENNFKYIKSYLIEIDEKGRVIKRKLFVDDIKIFYIEYINNKMEICYKYIDKEEIILGEIIE